MGYPGERMKELFFFFFYFIFVSVAKGLRQLDALVPSRIGEGKERNQFENNIQLLLFAS